MKQNDFVFSITPLDLRGEDQAVGIQIGKGDFFRGPDHEIFMQVSRVLKKIIKGVHLSLQSTDG
jgi:hypothetical protein